MDGDIQPSLDSDPSFRQYATPTENPYIQKMLMRFAMPDGETLIYASFLPKQAIPYPGWFSFTARAQRPGA